MNSYLGEHEFILNRKGIITWKGAGAKIVRYRLRVEKGFYVESMQAFEDSDKLFVLASLSNWDYGCATIQAFNRKTGAVVWYQNFPAFNTGQSLVIDSKWVITGIGSIAKIDLRTGRYEWIHTRLYNHQNYAYNSFEIPRYDSNRIIFTESLSSDSSRASHPFRVVVDWSSGKIIENTNQ